MLIPISLQGKKHLVGSKKVKKIIRIDQDPRSIAMNEESGAEDLLRKKIWNVDSDIMAFVRLIGNFSTTCGYQCENIFKQTKVLEKLRQEKFDLGITESLFICGYPLFDHIGIKTLINADSTLFMDAIKYSLGEPSATTFYPSLISPLPDKMSLIGRVKNTIGMLLSMYFSTMRFEKELEMIKPYYKGAKTWREHVEGVAFNMVNSNRYLDYASPTLPKTVFIGGMQVNTKQNGKTKLSKEWDEVLGLREQNVLVSFGSNAFSSDMPDEYKSAFLKVFESMPNTTFIWKYEIENATLANHLPNVKLTTWMPQNDILADDRLSLFVTHGGLGSTMELAYQGKPAVIIPLMADQPRNAHMLTRHGGAVQLSKNSLDKPEEIGNSIKSVLEDSTYRKNAEQLAKVLAEQPFSPKEVVLKHCDFAVKFGALESLNSEGRKLNMFQFYSYDIFALFFSVILVVLLILALIVKTCIRFVMRISRNGEKAKVE
uniref:UDP-glucuronosyltransferase n=1 Tax=Caenorhabditis japonica TaxID=281687 RepID=A0A8R1DMY2_CAEJA